MYTIKKIKWNKSPHYEQYYGDVDGGYRIEKRDYGGWYWGYCWDEYYDEGQHDCDDLESGKQAAQEHFESRVKNMLDEVVE